LAIAPVLSLAFLVQGKNPYYFVLYALPALAVVAAAGVRGLPNRPTQLICIAALCGCGIFCAYKTRTAAGLPTVSRSVELLAAKIPAHAVAFSPLIYGSLIVRRPDVQLFTLHALSRREGWYLPACSELPAKIRTLLEHDPRPTSHNAEENPGEVFFVLGPGPSEGAFLWYLKQIYADATPADLQCLVGPQPAVPIHVCGSDPAKCTNIYLVQRPLQ